MILRRSIDTASDMTISTGYPLTIPTIARPMPVLPDVGSMMVLPGVSLPSRSASSIILTASSDMTHLPQLRMS